MTSHEIAEQLDTMRQGFWAGPEDDLLRSASDALRTLADEKAQVARERDAAQSAIRAFLAQWEKVEPCMMAAVALAVVRGARHRDYMIDAELAALRAIVAEPTA